MSYAAWRKASDLSHFCQYFKTHSLLLMTVPNLACWFLEAVQIFEMYFTMTFFLINSTEKLIL